jgi:glucose-1-phosphatase
MMIRNIIFDLGGVLLNIDYQKTIDSFKKLGLKNFDEMYSQASQFNLFDDLEVGRIGEEKFVKAIKKKLPTEIEEQDILKAWNAMLLDFPIERFEMLKKVSKNYKIYLLSNTNIIHLKEYIKYLDNHFGYENFKNCFKKVWLSHEVNMRKPHPETFLKLLATEQLFVEETLFIDDSIQHVEGAKEAGLKAIWLDLKNTKIDVLNLFDADGRLFQPFIS